MKSNILRMMSHFLMLSSIGLLLFSCSEDEVIQPDYTKVHLIKKEVLGNTENEFAHTFNYEYNSEGKIVKKTWENIENINIYEYQYGSGVISIFHSMNSLPIDTTTLELNSRGLVVCKYNSLDNKMTRYKYDDQGYCIYTRNYEYGSDTSEIVQEVEVANFSYLEGNLILEERLYNGSTEGLVQNYYYKDKVNTIGYVNRGEVFFGKSSKNLTKLQGAIDEFDTESRLIKRTEQSNSVQSYEFY